MNFPLDTTRSSTDILEGDCVPVMAAMPDESVNLILTDPPYLCGYSDRTGRSILNDDRDDWLVPAFEQMFRVLQPDSFCISFYGWHRADAFIHAWRNAGFRIAEHMVFVKQYDSSCGLVRRRHEQAYLLTKGDPSLGNSLLPDVMGWQYTQNTFHPTQKPVPILRTLIEAFSSLGDLVLDPFCGSGSTLVAAQEAGRSSIGIELDPEYAQIARERLSVVSRLTAA
ncbi:MAG TPA: DNA methyltransferase [Tepidisphaeraceae bacterium]|jgi:site-specific DNA-methyltransferase (adenine-specific)|nr:DNA methyltransferase [Tepidisphaeraceae bacterium]